MSLYNPIRTTVDGEFPAVIYTISNYLNVPLVCCPVCDDIYVWTHIKTGTNFTCECGQVLVTVRYNAG